MSEYSNDKGLPAGIDRGPSIDVVIVNYRTPRLTFSAVQSALSAGAARIWIIDNASRDGSVDALRAKAGSRVVTIENDQNAGFGRAANLGAEHARGDVLLFLNSDASVRSGSIGAMVDALAQYDGRAIVGPRLVGADGQIQRSAGLVPRPTDLIVRGLGLHHLARAVARLPGIDRVVAGTHMAREYDLSLTAREPVSVSMVSGACFAIGREAFLELGGFDERYFMYFEDADLCRRANAAGWPILYVPDAVVDHIGGASSTGDYRFGPWHAESMIRYLRDWHGRVGVSVGIAILWCRAIGQALTLRSGSRRAFQALVAGLRTVIRNH